VLATSDGDPVLMVREDGPRREAWLAGMPVVDCFGTLPGNPTVESTDNLKLVRNLLRWLAGRQPLAWLEPFPPLDDYSKLRPTDRRAVPTLEMLPMISENERSLLAIVFPYTPVRAQTTLRIAAPVQRATELWTDVDWTPRLTSDDDGTKSIALDIPGDCDLLAVQFDLA